MVIRTGESRRKSSARSRHAKIIHLAAHEKTTFPTDKHQMSRRKTAEQMTWATT
ncbi:MAG: hypothetical protein ABIJ96_09845 [Elusimicrobiota bacterium]